MSSEVLFPPDGPSYEIMVVFPTALGDKMQPVVVRSCARCGVPVFPLGQDQHVAWHGSLDSAATVKLAGVGGALVRNAEPCAACGTTADICRESIRRGGPPCCKPCDQIDGHRERTTG